MQSLEFFFRHQYGRIVARLTRTLGLASLERAEDAVQAAMLKALKSWPLAGQPANPAGWLFDVARNHAIDGLRREGKQVALGEDDFLAECHSEPAFARELHDDELRLLFAICHPALPIEAQVALALKALCGFSLREIAAGLLTNETALAQRLARARKTITSQQIDLSTPPPEALPARRRAVLATIYLMFNEGYHSGSNSEVQRREICMEAITLAREMSAHPVSAHADVHALAALLLLHGARLDARVDTVGGMLLLPQQPRERWDQDMIALGMRHLDLARDTDQLTSAHLQAGIAAEHALAASYGQTNWPAILSLYETLLLIDQSPVARLGHAVAVANVHGVEEGLRLLVPLLSALPERFPFGLIAQGDWLLELGRFAKARESYVLALAEAGNVSQSAFISGKLRLLDVACPTNE